MKPPEDSKVVAVACVPHEEIADNISANQDNQESQENLEIPDSQ